MLRVTLAALLAFAAALAFAPTAQAEACTYDYAHFEDAGVHASCPVPVFGHCKVSGLGYWSPVPKATCGETTVPPAMPWMCTFTQATQGFSADCSGENYGVDCQASASTWDPLAPAASC